MNDQDLAYRVQEVIKRLTGFPSDKVVYKTSQVPIGDDYIIVFTFAGFQALTQKYTIIEGVKYKLIRLSVEILSLGATAKIALHKCFEQLLADVDGHFRRTNNIQWQPFYETKIVNEPLSDNTIISGLYVDGIFDLWVTAEIIETFETGNITISDGNGNIIEINLRED